MKKNSENQLKISWIGAIAAVLVALVGGFFAYKTALDNPTVKIIKKGDCSGDFTGNIESSEIRLNCSKKY